VPVAKSMVKIALFQSKFFRHSRTFITKHLCIGIIINTLAFKLTNFTVDAKAAAGT